MEWLKSGLSCQMHPIKHMFSWTNVMVLPSISTRCGHDSPVRQCLVVHPVVSRFISYAVSTFSLWGGRITILALIIGEEVPACCCAHRPAFFSLVSNLRLSCQCAICVNNSVCALWRGADVGNCAFCTVTTLYYFVRTKLCVVCAWPEGYRLHSRIQRQRERGLFVLKLNSHYIHSPH